LRELNAKGGREGIFKPTARNESLHEIDNDNGIRVCQQGLEDNYRIL
jgi:hypothetical protein